MPSLPPAILALQKLLDDGPMPDMEEDRGLEPSLVQADDLLPVGKALTVAGKLKAALGGAKLGKMGLAGLGIKLKPNVKFDRYRRVMQGMNPLDLHPTQLGKHVAAVGPDIRHTNQRLIGSQMLDQHGDVSPDRLLKGLFASEGLAGLQPTFKKSLGPATTLGSYYPHQIMVNSMHLPKIGAAPKAEEVLAGLVGHEGQHAVDSIRNPWKMLGSNPAMMGLPGYASTHAPERFIPDMAGLPNSNKFLSASGMFREENLLHVLEESSMRHHLPWRIQERLRHGADPRALAQLWHKDPQVQSALGDIFRIARGNRGFRGKDPYLVDSLMTKGHFDAPIKGEMDIPVYRLAKQQAEGGGEVGHWENEFHDMVDAARTGYKSPIRPTNPYPKEPDLFARDKKAALAAALLGTVGITSFEAGRHVSQARAQQPGAKPFVGPPRPRAFVGPHEGAPRPGEGAGTLEQFHRLLKEYNRSRRERGLEP